MSHRSCFRRLFLVHRRPIVTSLLGCIDLSQPDSHASHHNLIGCPEHRNCAPAGNTASDNVATLWLWLSTSDNSLTCLAWLAASLCNSDAGNLVTGHSPFALLRISPALTDDNDGRLIALVCNAPSIYLYGPWQRFSCLVHLGCSGRMGLVWNSAKSHLAGWRPAIICRTRAAICVGCLAFLV